MSTPLVNTGQPTLYVINKYIWERESSHERGWEGQVGGDMRGTNTVPHIELCADPV